MNFRRKRKSNTEIEEFDITALLDILVILLVFLLKSFNDSELSVDLANELALPYSFSRSAVHDGVILQVNKKRNVFINTVVIGNMDNPNTFEVMKENLKKEYERRFSIDESKKKEDQLINFLFDKALIYADIDKIMDVSSESGFGKYKLIIQGEE